jgi:hypothetical protein
VSTTRANGKNGKKKPARRAKKPVGELVVPPHGRGKIWRGPCAHPVAGPGRPTSAIRARLAGSFDERIPILEEIADARVILRAKCTKCGHEPKAKTIAETQPTYDDRLRAMDIMGKLSLGAHTGVPIDEVRRRVARTIDVIRETLQPEYSAPVIAALRPVWA